MVGGKERARERAFECLIRVTLEIMFDRVWVVREFKSPQQGTLIAKQSVECVPCTVRSTG